MIGIILITHGRLGVEFVAALEHVIGKQKNLLAMEVSADDNILSKCDELKQMIEKVDTGKGVLILTDMFGGTPSNIAISVIKRKNTEVLTGLNLPMLLKIASLRSEHSLSYVVEAGKTAGRKYINIASVLLEENS